MKTCTICKTHWKDSKREKKNVEKNHTLIYGCRRCQKGHWEKNNNHGDFDFGELKIKEKSNE